MLRALLEDLDEIDGVELLTTRDARMSPLQFPACRIEVIGEHDDIWQRWEQCVAQSDAIWPIAPESDGILLRLTELALLHGKQLFGSSPAAVKLTSSKSATVDALALAGIKVVPTFVPDDWSLAGAGPWVAKPNDGVGCEDSSYFSDSTAMLGWLQDNQRLWTHVVQPYLPGIPASLSMLCLNGRAYLLSCNRQKILLTGGAFHYSGSIVNDMQAHWETFDVLARAIAIAIPGLAGYVGVDVLVDADGSPCVLEINPRLTTSYTGLKQAIGCNPASLTLELFYNQTFELPPGITRNIAEVHLHA